MVFDCLLERSMSLFERDFQGVLHPSRDIHPGRGPDGLEQMGWKGPSALLVGLVPTAAMPMR